MVVHRVQERLIQALLSELVRVRRDTAPQLIGVSEEIRKVIVAQNALRTCVEAAVTDAIPFSPAFPIELAIRLASYAVSILPDKSHDDAIDAIVAGLRPAHATRMAKGVRIKADWS